jgi:hypothetical protein
MQQLKSRDPAEKTGSIEKETTIMGKVQPQKRISAVELAARLGMDFPTNGMPVIIDEQEGPVAVRADDLVSAGSSFMTDCSGQIVTVQPMMGG